MSLDPEPGEDQRPGDGALDIDPSQAAVFYHSYDAEIHPAAVYIWETMKGRCDYTDEDCNLGMVAIRTSDKIRKHLLFIPPISIPLIAEDIHKYRKALHDLVRNVELEALTVESERLFLKRLEDITSAFELKLKSMYAQQVYQAGVDRPQAQSMFERARKVKISGGYFINAVNVVFLGHAKDPNDHKDDGQASRHGPWVPFIIIGILFA
ncbi:hypothetical protein CPB84DRAFT_1783654 [Gymnopilus junonius]|uniref:Uncharacterized protein n=1 Tax=Gymnopilus junonius TaxID=109634 RepID=A0A9P5TM79_GYMJU|nr:hypothetical protein CPB84DRAFT_1783654 [Gymnopilus junonius]